MGWKKSQRERTSSSSLGWATLLGLLWISRSIHTGQWWPRILFLGLFFPVINYWSNRFFLLFVMFLTFLALHVSLCLGADWQLSSTLGMSRKNVRRRNLLDLGDMCKPLNAACSYLDSSLLGIWADWNRCLTVMNSLSSVRSQSMVMIISFSLTVTSFLPSMVIYIQTQVRSGERISHLFYRQSLNLRLETCDPSRSSQIFTAALKM